MLTNRTDPTWRFEILRGRQGFDVLRPRWQALVDGLPNSTYLQQPGWIGSYLDAIARPDETLYFVAASRGTELGGVLVLKRSAGLQAWLKPEVEMVTGEHMVLADLVGDVRDRSLWPAMLDWLARQRAMRWAVWRTRSDLPSPNRCAKSRSATSTGTASAHMAGSRRSSATAVEPTTGVQHTST